jgi:hypothetical protein
MTPPVKRYDIRSHGNGFPPDVYERAAGVWVSGADYDVLAAQMAGLRADAERYRWLRAHRPVLLLTGFFGNGCMNKNIHEVDATIDAKLALPAPPAATTHKSGLRP